MCNVGVAYYKAKDLPRAERYLDQCLVIGKSLDAAFLDNVAKVEKVVVDKLKSGDFSPVDLVVEPSTAETVIEGPDMHGDSVVGSRRIWLPFGGYTLKIHAEGYADQSVTVDATAHTPVIKRVALERAATKPVAEQTPIADQPPQVTATTALQAPPVEVHAEQKSKLPALVATGVTGAATVTTILFWSIARSHASDAGNAMNPDVYFDEVDAARTNQHRSWIAGAVTGVAAAASAFLWYRVVF